ncbi:MAG: acylphosphatase, partial [Planctomycetales bacterium]
MASDVLRPRPNHSPKVKPMMRRAVIVEGIVQGVGFRPFVHRLAGRYRLGGFVGNRAGSVCIEVEGEAAAVECFLRDLTAEAPTTATIVRLEWTNQPPRGEDDFHIQPSEALIGEALIGEASAGSAIFPPADVATCADCLRELFDPADRRHRYPFINCVACGPRFTVIGETPYDRSRTTMAAFPLCDACRSEYENPTDRRFHAQAIACAACGPRLSALDAAGNKLDPSDVVAWAAKRLA